MKEYIEKKRRNVDSNSIYPTDILSFLKRSLEHTIENKKEYDYIIGCACGSSEIAMPLAGLMQTELGFIRRSYRRGDNAPRVIKEHDAYFKANLRDKDALCIEDYVCTGNSLRKVMEKVMDYGVIFTIGASVRYSHEGNYLRDAIDESDFKLFYLSDENGRKR